MPRIEIKCTENGPNLIGVDGNVTTALCRCGGSNNKPYCDRTHAIDRFSKRGERK